MRVLPKSGDNRSIRPRDVHACSEYPTIRYQPGQILGTNGNDDVGRKKGFVSGVSIDFKGALIGGYLGGESDTNHSRKTKA